MKSTVQSKLFALIVLIIAVVVNIIVVNAVVDYFGGRGSVPDPVAFVLIVCAMITIAFASKGILKAFPKGNARKDR